MFAQKLARSAVRFVFRFAAVPLLFVFCGAYLFGGADVFRALSGFVQDATNSINEAMTSARLQQQGDALKSSVEDLAGLVACRDALDAQIAALEDQRFTIVDRVERQQAVLRAVLNTISCRHGGHEKGVSVDVAEQDAVHLLQSLEAERSQLRKCELALRRAVEHRAE